MKTTHPLKAESLKTLKAISHPDPNALRDALRFWTTGVTIVAAKYQDLLHGMTVNSFTSISLEPPLVMVSLEKVTRTHGYVQGSGAFAVTILSAEQRSLSDRFAGRETENEDRFEGVESFALETGSPILSAGWRFSIAASSPPMRRARTRCSWAKCWRPGSLRVTSILRRWFISIAIIAG